MTFDAAAVPILANGSLSTQIPVSLWFLARNKRNGKVPDRASQP